MKTKFEAGKMYTTRDERKAKVYEVYEHAIHGAVLTNSGLWASVVWHPKGQRIRDRLGPEDLMLPKPEPREWYCLLEEGRSPYVIYPDSIQRLKERGFEVIKVREVLEE